MTLDRALKAEYRLADAMRGVYADAARWHWTHDALLAKRKERVHALYDWQHCPRWVHAFVNGIESELRRQMYQRVEWVLIGCDGRMFRKPDDSWLDGSHVYKSSMIGFHVWRESLDAGEFHPLH